jgi:hypothetical protein
MAEHEYPQSEKLSRIASQRQGISEFLEWIGEQGMYLCTADPENGRFHPVARTADSLTYEMYEIDEKELERERRAMLARMNSG